MAVVQQIRLTPANGRMNKYKGKTHQMWQEK